jgi:hypothetical protein
MKMQFRKILALGLAAAALIGFGSTANAQIWSGSFTDMGVDYTLTFQSLSGNVGTFDLTLDTTGYNQQSDGFLDSVDIKAWDGTDISFVLTDAPDGSAWNPTEGPISSGPVSNTGCGGSGAGFACVEAVTKGIFDVDLGDPYSFTFEVTADSFLSSVVGAHVGAGYADSSGRGSSYGITSVSMIPEPEIYAMMLAGIALMGFVARRRNQQTQDQLAAA